MDKYHKRELFKGHVIIRASPPSGYSASQMQWSPSWRIWRVGSYLMSCTLLVFYFPFFSWPWHCICWSLDLPWQGTQYKWKLIFRTTKLISLFRAYQQGHTTIKLFLDNNWANVFLQQNQMDADCKKSYSCIVRKWHLNASTAIFTWSMLQAGFNGEMQVIQMLRNMMYIRIYNNTFVYVVAASTWYSRARAVVKSGTGGKYVITTRPSMDSIHLFADIHTINVCCTWFKKSNRAKWAYLFNHSYYKLQNLQSVPCHQVRDANFDEFQPVFFCNNGLSLEFLEYFRNFLIEERSQSILYIRLLCRLKRELRAKPSKAEI